MASSNRPSWDLTSARVAAEPAEAGKDPKKGDGKQRGVHEEIQLRARTAFIDVGRDDVSNFAVAALSLPGLALLGAGLTPAALGSRTSAASAGLAMGVGVPVAAVASAMIAIWIVAAFAIGLEHG